MTDICLRTCADPRVTLTLRAIEDAILAQYEEFPYTQRDFGAELGLAPEDSRDGTPAALLRVMRPALKAPLRAYILIGHMGPACGPGCAAYEDAYEGRLPIPIKPGLERELHWRNLLNARELLERAARGYGRQLKVIMLIDHHGYLEFVTNAQHAPEDVRTIEIDEVLNLIAE